MNTKIFKLWVISIIVSILFSNGCKKISQEDSILSQIVFGKGEREEGERLQTYKIYVMDVDGKNQTKLAEIEKMDLVSPICSPDGTKILFCAYERGSYKVESNGSLTWIEPNEIKQALYVMDTDGKNLIRLTEMGENGGIGPYSWSPDSKKIIFQTVEVYRVTDDEGIIFKTKIKNPRIYLVDADRTNHVKLITKGYIQGYGSKWSPDSKKFVFLSGEDKGDICIIDINEKNIIRLANLGKTSNLTVHLSWSPDGKKIVLAWKVPPDNLSPFCSRECGDFEIFIIDVNGRTRAKRLTNNSVNDWFPTWSPRGKKIAFIHENMLWIMNADGKYQTQLTNLWPSSISWSPDGKKIAFSGFKSGEKYNDIYVIDIETKKLTNLTNTPDIDETNPSWRLIVKK